jgi:hypothetical protein
MKNLTVVTRDHFGPKDGTEDLPICCKCGRTDALNDRGDYFECRWDFDCGHVIHKDDCRVIDVASYDELACLINDLCTVLHARGRGILGKYSLSFSKVI